MIVNPKILFISPYFEPAYSFGGPVNSSAALCKALIKKGIDVTVLTTNADRGGRLKVPLGESVIQDGVPIYYYPLSSEFFFYSPSFVQAIKEAVPTSHIVFLQVLFTHAFYPSVRTLIKNGIPFIIPLRGQFLPWAMNYKPIRKRIYMSLFGWHYLNKAAALYCTDEVEAFEITKLGIKPPTFIIPNMVDELFFGNLPNKGYLREKFRIPEDHKILLFLGRLHPVKRPDIAIKALPVDERIHLVIIGLDEARLTPTLLKIVSSMNVEARVHISDQINRTDIIKAMVDADLLIMPSEENAENFGMTAAEAMAVGLPVITTESVPTGRIAAQAGAGETVPLSIDSFKDKINELIFDSFRLKQMGEKGKSIAQEKFRSDKIVCQMIDQIEAILTSGRPTPE